MTSSTRKLAIITATAAVSVLVGIGFVHPVTKAFSQQMSMMNHGMSGDQQVPGMMQHMMQIHGQEGMQTGVNAPSLAGQDAFGANHTERYGKMSDLCPRKRSRNQ